MKEQKVTVKGNVQPEDVLQTVSKTGKKTAFWEAEAPAPAEPENKPSETETAPAEPENKPSETDAAPAPAPAPAPAESENKPSETVAVA